MHTSACSYACAAFFLFLSLSLFFCQVMHTALSFDSAPKIKLSTSITHETLCTRSHDRPTHRGGGISGTCFSLLLSNDMQCTLPLIDIPFFWSHIHFENQNAEAAVESSWYTREYVGRFRFSHVFVEKHNFDDKLNVFAVKHSISGFSHFNTIAFIQSFRHYCYSETVSAVFFRCLSLHISLVAFQRAVKRKFTPLFSLFPISLRFTDQLIPLSSSVCLVCIFCFASSFPTKKHTHTQTHTRTKKKHKLTCTPPNFPPFSSLCPPTSHPSAALAPPTSPTLSLSRPEAAASTCIAGCYVGTMTTVMNSTWRSRIQADVSLCGCSASNGAHVSRD